MYLLDALERVRRTGRKCEDDVGEDDDYERWIPMAEVGLQWVRQGQTVT